MKGVISFAKKESVLVISVVLAVVSSFFVPGADYLSFIDFSAKKLLNTAKTTRLVVSVLVLLCFFFSCFITNDVALITFVPFAITVLSLADKKSVIPITVILQTIAANMGSSLTPIGNPQNIYIFTVSGLTLADFLSLMLPYAALTLVFFGSLLFLY